MEDLKIVIGKNKDVANQAKDLLLKLGLYVSSEKRHNFYGWVARVGSGDYINDISVFNKDKAKLVTIQDLKDMVVLKRNDPKDATHTDQDNWKWFVSSDGTGYVFACGNSQNLPQWDESSLDMVDLKPIKEEAMKEYLDPDNGYDFIKWTGFAHPPESFIEVPEGAMFATGDDVIFRKDKYLFVDGEWEETDVTLQKCKGYGLKVIWHREKESTMQEQLDYADELRDMGESGWSKEKHSHYKKDISHLNMIDPYRIADIYDLHPCADHIMKKSLCAGNRGHKDMLRDIQDIIDTAERWKQMIEEDGNEI